MHARVSFYQLAAGGDADAAVKAFEDNVSGVEALEGEQGVMLLVDRDSGKAITVTFWDTEEHLQSSAERANQIRKGAATSGNLSIQGVEHYEVVMQTLR
jgi:heme-degrading monooxygenase HmoA